MRNAALGAMVVIALSMGLMLGWLCTGNAEAQRPMRETPAFAGQSHPMLAMAADVDQRRQQITLIDSNTRSMVVYHIDKSTGEVSLRSVRSIHWDLQMDEFNGKNPLPREIRSLLDPR